ncbi:claudin-10-like isoform X2 [Erpetoichthys calabaricus]|uniref:claudin-10-like isoform X2 n=1 Tax=Erpetoichthys calabaricus TaxID=27687 RepID=UPI0022343A40|nr:claudin-10-like isoform X2 [Erpetoichthys calabaricus]
MQAMQILAFVGCVGGLGAILASTISDEWKTTSRASSVITATWVFQGLWRSCAGNALGAVHCRRHLTILKLDSYIQVCRGLMIAAVCLGFFGAILALVGMKCTKIGGSDRVKARIACLAGLNFLLGGLSSMTACSLYAHRITSEFFDPTFVAQKYELGAALFIGWAGSALCILGGAVFCFSMSEGGTTTTRVGYTYSGAASFLSSRIKPQHEAADVRSSRGKGIPPKQFDKNAYV